MFVWWILFAWTLWSQCYYILVYQSIINVFICCNNSNLKMPLLSVSEWAIWALAGLILLTHWQITIICTYIPAVLTPTTGIKIWSGPFLDLDHLIASLKEPWPLIANWGWAGCGWSQRTEPILTLIWAVQTDILIAWSSPILQLDRLISLWSRSQVSVQQVYTWPPLVCRRGRGLGLRKTGTIRLKYILVIATPCNHGISRLVSSLKPGRTEFCAKFHVSDEVLGEIIEMGVDI